jgi:hypothetical protein
MKVMKSRIELCRHLSLGFAIQEVIAQLQWNLRNGIGLLGSQWRYINLWLLSSACEWDTIRMGEVLVWRGQAWLNKFTLNRSFLQSQETTSGIHANTESCDSLLNSDWLVQNSEHQGPTMTNRLPTVRLPGPAQLCLGLSFFKRSWQEELPKGLTCRSSARGTGSQWEVQWPS